MAKEITKVLGQAIPAVINTEQTLYAVTEGNQAVISSLTVTNQDAGAITHKIAVVPGGSGITTTAQHYIRFNKSIATATSEDIKIGITMDEFDEIRVEYCSVFKYGPCTSRTSVISDPVLHF